jgi:hypothetical protein
LVQVWLSDGKVHKPSTKTKTTCGVPMRTGVGTEARFARLPLCDTCWKEDQR